MSQAVGPDRGAGEAATGLDGPRLAALFAFLLLAFFACAHLFHGLHALAGDPDRLSTFLFSPAVRYSDFTIYADRADFPWLGTDPYTMRGWPFVYFPVAAWVFPAIAAIGGAHPLLAFQALAGLGYLVAIGLAARRAPRPLRLVLAVLIVTSYPFLFAFDRANLELLAALPLWVATALLVAGQDLAAAAALGLAASFKFYPLIFVLDFVRRGRWREAMVAVGTFAALTGAALVAMPGPTAVAGDGFLRSLGFFSKRYVFSRRPDELAVDHALLSIYKAFGPQAVALAESGVVTHYLPVAAVAFGAFWLAAFRRASRVTHFVVCSVAAVVLPPVSFDYTLLNLYPAVWLLLSRAMANPRPVSRAGVAALLLFVPVLVPLAYRLDGWGFGGQVKAVALLGLLLLGAARDLDPAAELILG